MKKILLVDDAPTVLNIMEYALSEEGYDVVTATCADEAKIALNKKSFDIGIFDVNMPGQNGIELTADVLKTENGKNMKIVIVTTESSDDLQKAGREAGAVGWLVKPFDGEELLELVGQL